MQDPIMELRGITKTFPGVKALNDVSFSLYSGEVHVLMGENGAGKSTLMKIINGQYQAYEGEMLIDGKACRFDSSHDSIVAGIAMIHQELNPVLDMNISENIFLGREQGSFGVLNRREMQEQAKIALANIGLDLNLGTCMRELSVAQIQMVEIAKAVSLNAHIIIMDEPTSALSDREVEVLYTIIRKLRAKRVGIIYISHKIDEVFKIADRITILRDGCTVDTRAVSGFDVQSLISLMVGREITQIYPQKISHTLGNVVLEVRGLCLKEHYQNVSFSVHAGEILGFAGLMGAGRSEVVESIFGVRHAQGEIFLNGSKTSIRSPAQAILHGLALVTEDRKQTGLNLKATVREDTSVVTLDHYCLLHQIIRKKSETAAVKKTINDLQIKTSSLSQLIGNLSGGNQQKVIIGRWLLDEPDILILDEPTRGIDVGAKYEIYKIITQLAAQGKAIMIVSSEIPELIGLCDRCVVMHEGTITAQLEHEELTQESILQYATNIDAGHSE